MLIGLSEFPVPTFSTTVVRTRFQAGDRSYNSLPAPLARLSIKHNLSGGDPTAGSGRVAVRHCAHGSIN